MVWLVLTKAAHAVNTMQNMTNIAGIPKRAANTMIFRSLLSSSWSSIVILSFGLTLVLVRFFASLSSCNQNDLNLVWKKTKLSRDNSTCNAAMAVCRRTSVKGMRRVNINQTSISFMLGVLGREFRFAMNRVVSTSMPVRFTVTMAWKYFSYNVLLWFVLL